MPGVFHAISDMGIGGGGIFLTQLLSQSQKNTGSLTLLPKGSLLCSRLREAGIPYAALSLSGERSFSTKDVFKYRSFLKEHTPALLVSHASLSAKIAAKSLSIPTLSVRHCDTPPPAKLLWLYNAVTDATVATSLPLAEHLRDAGVKNVFAIENGYTPMGVPSDRERLAAKRAFSIPADRIAIGLSGRLVPVKGHVTAIDALSLLGEEKNHFLLCFLGDGCEKENLRERVRALSLENEVRFLGFHADVRPFYYAMDAHISCSFDSETSSLALAEGLSAGCATFACDIPGNRARVGEGGCFFPCGDAKALASLFRLLSDNTVKESLRDRAAARARALPTWERTRAAYGTLFDTFCREVAAKGCFFEKDMLQ